MCTPPKENPGTAPIYFLPYQFFNCILTGRCTSCVSSHGKGVQNFKEYPSSVVLSTVQFHSPSSQASWWTGKSTFKVLCIVRSQGAQASSLILSDMVRLVKNMSLNGALSKDMFLLLLSFLSLFSSHQRKCTTQVPGILVHKTNYKYFIVNIWKT